MNNSSEFVYIIIYIFAFFVLILAAIIVFVSFSRKKIFQKEIEKKEIELQMQKEVLQATILSQEKERERIAQDLHDEISSKLIAVSLNLHLLNSEKITQDYKQEVIKNLIEINQNTIENSRKIAHNLLPPVLEKFGLDAALQELALNYNKSFSVKINYKNEVNFTFTNSEINLHVFRVIQELITNSIKHGKASTIDIHFIEKDKIYCCYYKDNGIGMDVNELETKKGLGFRNIESRINYIKGNYSLNSKIGKGINFQFNFNND